MGNLFTSAACSLVGRYILIVGPPKSGKSFLVKKLKGEDFADIYRATPGLEKCNHQMNSKYFKFFDFAGQFPESWVEALNSSYCVIFVVDASKGSSLTEDKEYWNQAKDGISTMASNPACKKLAILFNQMDRVLDTQRKNEIVRVKRLLKFDELEWEHPGVPTFFTSLHPVKSKEKPFDEELDRLVPKRKGVTDNSEKMVGTKIAKV